MGSFRQEGSMERFVIGLAHARLAESLTAPLFSTIHRNDAGVQEHPPS